MIRAISNSMPFTSKYSLDLNQDMGSPGATLRRDYLLGVYTKDAINGQKVVEQAKNFLNGEYKTNETAPCQVELDLPNYLDCSFERTMNEIGVKFEKMA